MGETFKAGDVVKLKSGGPDMTINWVDDYLGALSACCQWFDQKNVKQEATFPVTSLEAVQT